MHSMAVFFVVLGLVSALPGFLGDFLDPFYAGSPVAQNQAASGLGPISQNQVAQNSGRDYGIYDRSLFGFGATLGLGYPVAASPATQNQVASGAGPVTQNQVANRRGLYPYGAYKPYYMPSDYYLPNYYYAPSFGLGYAGALSAYNAYPSSYSPAQSNPVVIQNELKNRRINDRVVSHNEMNNSGY